MRDVSGNFALICVLPEESFLEKHIPGSDNIALDSAQFTEKVEQKVGGKEKIVVVYCASKTCDASAKAARKLEESGFDKVFDYEGGLEAWMRAGLEVGAGPTA